MPKKQNLPKKFDEIFAVNLPKLYSMDAVMEDTQNQRSSRQQKDWKLLTARQVKNNRELNTIMNEAQNMEF